MDPVRLACLIHATSVRSEPESNSQKKILFRQLNVAELLFFGALAGSGHLTTSFSFIVFRVPSGGSPSFRGAAGSRSFSTVLFSRIERAPFGRNGWVIYQNGPPGARGWTEDFSSFSGARKTQWNQAFRPHEVSLGEKHASRKRRGRTPKERKRPLRADQREQRTRVCPETRNKS